VSSLGCGCDRAILGVARTTLVKLRLAAGSAVFRTERFADVAVMSREDLVHNMHNFLNPRLNVMARLHGESVLAMLLRLTNDVAVAMALSLHAI
jgi:hypothetical protein